MEDTRNIVIGDESALFAYLHSDWGERIGHFPASANPLVNSAEKLGELSAFNVDNPIYGSKPIVVLVPEDARRRLSENIRCRHVPSHLPEQSFFSVRDGLFMTSPELTYVRMAEFRTEMQLAQIAMNLCGRYYLDKRTGNVCDRSMPLTTPDKLHSFCTMSSSVRGSKKALSALRWVYQNSGSPTETIVQLLLTLPWGRGGYALPLTHMNFDISAGRLARIAEQNSYSIDCANPDKRVGVEYDGQDSHPDSSHDKRRRNELKALGWDIFPLEIDVLNNPDRFDRFARIVAARLEVRLRRSHVWPKKYLKLRKELGLRN